MKTWIRSVLLLVAIPSLLGAQQPPWVGHWVNVDPSDQGMFILDVTPDGHVHRLMPAPQFSATYRLEHDRLLMRMGDGSVDSGASVHGDSIVQGSRVFLTRLAGGHAGDGGVQGTWSAASSSPMEMFMTFRSDSAVVLEVGFPVQASINADTLRLQPAQGPAATYVVQQVGDTLHLRDAAGKDRRFVRRPWGCLGIGTFDAGAPECH